MPHRWLRLGRVLESLYQINQLSVLFVLFKIWCLLTLWLDARYLHLRDALLPFLAFFLLTLCCEVVSRVALLIGLLLINDGFEVMRSWFPKGKADTFWGVLRLYLLQQGLVLNDGGSRASQPRVGSQWPLDAIMSEKVSLMLILSVSGSLSCPLYRP